MSILAGIIEAMRAEDANRKSQFISYVTSLDVGILAKQYNEIAGQAPRRHQQNVKRRYLFERSGVPGTGAQSNRTEEHLAIALYLKFCTPGGMTLPDGRSLEILDYQIPLKAIQADSGVGKIDMLGLIDRNQLAIMELKVKGGDTPIAATLEALVYAAIVNANLEDLSAELTNKSYPLLKRGRPEIIVLAPADYWEAFHKYDVDWVNKVAPNLCRVANELSTEIQFLGLNIGHLTFGREGKSPNLEGNVLTTQIFKSNISNET